MTHDVSRPPGGLECDVARPSLGVLVLGVVDPDERRALEDHLAGCPDCAATFADLAVLPGLMHRLTPAEAAAGLPDPPPRFAERLLEAAQADQRAAQARRRHRLSGLVTAAAVVVLLAAAGLALVTRDEPAVVPAAVTRIVSGTDAHTGVHARVRLTPRASGTQLTLSLNGVEPGEHCRLVARDLRGDHEVAATWVASYDGEAKVTGTTSLSVAAIRRLEVVTPGGHRLVALQLPPSTRG